MDFNLLVQEGLEVALLVSSKIAPPAPKPTENISFSPGSAPFLKIGIDCDLFSLKRKVLRMALLVKKSIPTASSAIPPEIDLISSP